MRLSTGIDTIDRTLGGGLQPGSIVALLAPPEAQSLPVLCAHTGLRPTHYFTTLRTVDSVQRQLAQQDLDPKPGGSSTSTWTTRSRPSTPGSNSSRTVTTSSST
ncbi:hypothetical protein ACFQH8_08195 [Halomicroarcula sp. GCM10025710]